MSDASWELQKAIVAALTEDSPASIAGGRIYDRIPDAASQTPLPDSAFPYVQIGEADAIPDDVSTSAGGQDDGEAETITIHAWSRYAGQKEVKQIMQQIKDRLHGQSLTVTGRASALVHVRSRRAFLDPDGKTRHGVVAVEVIHRI